MSTTFKCVLIAMLYAASVCAQEQMAMNFLHNDFWGTARFRAVGASVAVGGDFTSAWSNPSGLAFKYNKEATGTAQFFQPKLTNHFRDGLTVQSHTPAKKYFDAQHIGYVYPYIFTRKNPQPVRKGFLNIVGSIQYSKLNEFSHYSELSFSDKSIAQLYAEDANNQQVEPGYLSNNSFGQIGFIHYLLDYQSQAYRSEVSGHTSPGWRYAVSGASRMGVVSFATNFNNLFYVGFSLGFPYLNYQEKVDYEENGSLGYLDDQTNYNHTIEIENKVQSLSGFHYKVGAIYRVNPVLRLGVSFNSPIWFSLQQERSTTYTTSIPEFEITQFLERKIGTPVFKYVLKTPPVITVGFSIFNKKKAFLAVDIDYIDYHKIDFFASTAAGGENETLEAVQLNDLSRQILDQYRKVINFRIGGEINFGSVQLRGGYAQKENPYKKSATDFTQRAYSFGLGYRFFKYSYIDLTVSIRKINTSHQAVGAINGFNFSTSDSRTLIYVTYGHVF